MHPKWGTSPSLSFYFDIYGQPFQNKILQPDHLCKPHKINIVTAKNTISHIFVNPTIFTQLLLTVVTNLPNK